MSLLTLYARREPTNDSVAISQGVRGKTDVVVYHDAACTKLAGRFPWYFSSLPRRNSRTLMLNCWRWNLQWA
jgi:hypothetical protein